MVYYLESFEEEEEEEEEEMNNQASQVQHNRISTSTIVHGFCLFLFCRIRALRETHIPTNSHQYAMNLFYFRQRSVLYRQCTTKTDVIYINTLPPPSKLC
ncbi:unnamed protein product [Rotaria magnacalcarata]